jgi:hypothetical protein
MMPCAPGSHPHSDQRNWQPAASPDEYLRNCREGIEEFSERRYAKLTGLTRKQIWVGKCYAAIPSDLFEMLLDDRKATGRDLNGRSLLAIGRGFLDQDAPDEAERCPHCREVIRLRRAIDPRDRDVVARWLARAGCR